MVQAGATVRVKLHSLQPALNYPKVGLGLQFKIRIKQVLQVSKPIPRSKPAS